MNDKTGGTPSPFSLGAKPASAGQNLQQNTSSGAGATSGSIPNSPANFGRPAASPAGVPPVANGPSPSAMGRPAGTISGASGAGGNATSGVPGVGGSATSSVSSATTNTTSSVPGGANRGVSAESFQAGSAAGTTPGAAASSSAASGDTNTAVSGTNATPGGTTPAEPNNTPIDPNSPLARPLEKATVMMPSDGAPKPKTPKKGLMIGLGVAAGVVALVTIIAVLVINLNQPNPVAKALDKVLSNQAPSNISVNGNINIATNDSSAAVSNYQIALHTTGMPGSLINETSATVTMSGEYLEDTTMELNEIYAGGSDLFIRVDGLSDALIAATEAAIAVEAAELENSDRTEGDIEDVEIIDDEGHASEEIVSGEVVLPDDQLAEELPADEAGAAATTEVTEEDVLAILPQNLLLQTMVPIFQYVEGEWLRIPLDSETTTEIEASEETMIESETATDEENATSEESTATDELATASTTTCAIDFLNTLRSNTNSIAEIYRKNAFVQSEKAGNAIASKNYPVYQVTLEPEKYSGFMAGLKSAGLFDSYNACMQKASEGQRNSSDTENLVSALANLPNSMPALYVEVDNEFNFTRFYWTSSSADNTTTYDIGLSYPTNVPVSEPAEYVDLATLLQELFVGGLTEEETLEEGRVVDNSSDL